ncbi:MAG: polysaccharide biosynthesis/export family protein [Nitrospirota bacterium]
MKIFKIFTTACCLIFLLQAAPFPSYAQEYVLGEGDLLHITVYENADLATDARVSGDGQISFPLIGSVKLSGLTINQAEKKIASLLNEKYLVNPQVSVFISEYRSKKVTVLGEVKIPGLFELNSDVTLLEIISKAGGLTEGAGDEVVIKRKSPSPGDEGESITVSLKVLNHGDRTANVLVQDGDSIYVARAGFVYVTGEVKNPGKFKIEPGMTVMKAIALAEGCTDKAASDRTSLIRKKDGKESSLKVGMDTLVQPDDVISVPESFF